MLLRPFKDKWDQNLMHTFNIEVGTQKKIIILTFSTNKEPFEDLSRKKQKESLSKSNKKF